MPKIAFKTGIISFTFFVHCTARNKAVALKWPCLLLLYNFITYIPFLETQNFGFQRQILKKRNLYFGVIIGKKSKIPDWHFLNRPILHLLGCFVCVLLQQSPAWGWCTPMSFFSKMVTEASGGSLLNFADLMENPLRNFGKIDRVTSGHRAMTS